MSKIQMGVVIGILKNPGDFFPEVAGEPPLNRNEKRAIALAVEGLELAEISDRMGVSINTAGSYLKGVARKTGVKKSRLAPYVLGLVRAGLGVKGKAK